jgi:hypothetical protein
MEPSKREREIIWCVQKYFYEKTNYDVVWIKKELKTRVSYSGAYEIRSG